MFEPHVKFVLIATMTTTYWEKTITTAAKKIASSIETDACQRPYIPGRH